MARTLEVLYASGVLVLFCYICVKIVFKAGYRSL